MTPRQPARRWWSRSAVEVAPELLGWVIRHDTSDGAVAVRLTEVEAYEGEDDPGSHAYRGKTNRNAVMFGPAGHLYVYFTYGMHCCANLVCEESGTGAAVLLRAGEVVEGRDLAYARRTSSGVVRKDVDLARGPARLTVALGLDLRHNGVDILGSGPVILEGPVKPIAAPYVCAGPRVGVRGDGGDGNRHPWRFWIAGDPSVSAYRPG